MSEDEKSEPGEEKSEIKKDEEEQRPLLDPTTAAPAATKQDIAPHLGEEIPLRAKGTLETNGDENKIVLEKIEPRVITRSSKTVELAKIALAVDDVPETGLKHSIQKSSSAMPASQELLKKKRVSTILFRKGSNMGQGDLHKLEYMYDSEKEYGDEDVFQKTESVMPPNTLQDKMNNLEVFYRINKRGIDEDEGGEGEDRQTRSGDQRTY